MLMLRDELFAFVSAKPTVQPNGTSAPVSGTNNEAERTLRGTAEARKTGRTNKTIVGTRRQTIVVSVLESLRPHLPTFTLSSVIAEILRWSTVGESCFATLLAKLHLSAPCESILDRLLPVPSG